MSMIKLCTEEAAAPLQDHDYYVLPFDGNVIGATGNVPEDFRESKILIFAINSRYYRGIPRLWSC